MKRLEINLRLLWMSYAKNRQNLNFTLSEIDQLCETDNGLKQANEKMRDFKKYILTFKRTRKSPYDDGNEEAGSSNNKPTVEECLKSISKSTSKLYDKKKVIVDLLKKTKASDKDLDIFNKGLETLERKLQNVMPLLNAKI